MGFVNIKITEKLAGELISCLDEEVAELTAENNRLVESISIKNKELEEKDLMIEKMGKYRLELEQKHIDCIRELEKHYDEKLKEQDNKIRNMTAGAKVVSDEKYEAERDKLVKLVTQLQEENAELKMVMKMAGDKPGRGRPKKA